MSQQQEEVKKGFDLVVSHRDPETGLVESTNSYTLHVVGLPDGGKMSVWERPPKSGNCWNKTTGEPIGRWEINPKTKQGKFVEGAEHIAFTPPETKDQKLARELIEKDAKIALLEKELAAISAEKKK